MSQMASGTGGVAAERAAGDARARAAGRQRDDHLPGAGAPARLRLLLLLADRPRLVAQRRGLPQAEAALRGPHSAAARRGAWAAVGWMKARRHISLNRVQARQHTSFTRVVAAGQSCSNAADSLWPNRHCAIAPLLLLSYCSACMNNRMYTEIVFVSLRVVCIERAHRMSVWVTHKYNACALHTGSEAHILYAARQPVRS